MATPPPNYNNWTNVGHLYGSNMYYSMPGGGESNNYEQAKKAWKSLGYGLGQDGSFKKGAVGGGGTTITKTGGGGKTVNTTTTGGIVPSGTNVGNFTTLGSKAAEVADPWASQRGQYQTKLSQLINTPATTMQENPFFKWQKDQGLEGVNRAAAAQGRLGSGNRMTALSDYAQNQSGQQYFTLANLLAKLSGADNQNPSAAGELLYRGGSEQLNLPYKERTMKVAEGGLGLEQRKTDFPYIQADLSRKGLTDALSEQTMSDFWRQLPRIY